MIILGIDPGSRKAGYGLIRVTGKKLEYIASGVMKYDNVENFVDRMGHIYDSCLEIVEEFQPDEIAVESLIYVKSVTSLAKLAQARGAMIAAFMKTHKEKVSEYSPNLIKSSVTGHGHASKESVDRTITMLLGQIDFKAHDESDALAIAICHALNRDNKLVGKTGASKRSRGRSLSKSVAHKISEKR